MPISVFGVASVVVFVGTTGTSVNNAKQPRNSDSTITADTHVADLYPGATKSITVKIQNNTAHEAVITSISNGSSNGMGNGSFRCPRGSATTDQRSDKAGLLQSDEKTRAIPANGAGIYTLSTRMPLSAINYCKDRTFTIPLNAKLKRVSTTFSAS